MAERTLILPPVPYRKEGPRTQAVHFTERTRYRNSSVAPILRAAREGKLGGKVVA